MPYLKNHVCDLVVFDGRRLFKDLSFIAIGLGSTQTASSHGCFECFAQVLFESNTSRLYSAMDVMRSVLFSTSVRLLERSLVPTCKQPAGWPYHSLTCTWLCYMKTTLASKHIWLMWRRQILKHDRLESCQSAFSTNAEAEHPSEAKQRAAPHAETSERSKTAFGPSPALPTPETAAFLGSHFVNQADSQLLRPEFRTGTCTSLWVLNPSQAGHASIRARH